MTPTEIKLTIDIIGTFAICTVLSISLYLGYLTIKKVSSALKSIFLFVLEDLKLTFASNYTYNKYLYDKWSLERKEKAYTKALDKLYSVKR